MKKTRLLMLLGSICLPLMLAALILPACANESAPTTTQTPTQAPAEVIKWRAQTCWPPSMKVYHEGDRRFADNVREMSNGRLDITVFSPGEICGCGEVFDAVKAGVIEMGMSWGVYAEGYNTAFAALSSTAGFFSIFDTYNYRIHGGGNELAQELYGKFNIYPVGPYVCPVPESGIWTNKPIYTLEDYKGMKIRMGGKVQTATLEEIGGIPVTMTGAEIYEALRKGTIDGTEFQAPSLDVSMGFAEICKYCNGPSWWQSCGCTDLWINADAWNSLPDDLKAIVRGAAAETVLWEQTAIDMDSIAAMETALDLGVTWIRMDQESLDTIGEILLKNIEKECEANPDYARVWQSQVAYAKSMIPLREQQAPFGYGTNPKWLLDY